ncbi:MAG: helical backbone metal receptor [Bacteroidota bacterium]
MPTPSRIISLVPSLTELLCELGLRDQLVGCTKYCVHPTDLRKSENIEVVGGTKTVKYDVIDGLQPDLIVANKEENTKEIVERLREKYEVIVTEIKTLEDAEDATRRLAAIWGLEARAETIISANRAALPPLTDQPKRALYLIWRKPWMSVGHDTYIHDMMSKFGYENVCGDQTRYPTLSEEDMVRINPEVVLLSSEPFPFKEKNVRELKDLLPDAEVKLVDGEVFSWYGARLKNIIKTPS